MIKKLRNISIEGCEQIGTGSSGTVYRIEPDAIVKVFYPGIGLDRIEREQNNARTAFVNGINTAIPFDIVRVGNLYGTVYELIANIPDRDTFIHCDCHVGNIMVRNDELILIDMADVGRGHPLFDIGAEYYHYKIMPALFDREQALKLLLGFVPEDECFTDRIWTDLVMHYFEPSDETSFHEIETIAEDMGGLRSLVVIVKQGQIPDELKAIIIDRARREFFPKIKKYLSSIRAVDRYFGNDIAID